MTDVARMWGGWGIVAVLFAVYCSFAGTHNGNGISVNVDQLAADTLPGLPPAEIDRGGVTFNFDASSARVFGGKADEHPVAVRCTVPDMTDESFYIGEGQVGYLWFEMKKNDKAVYEMPRFECRLKLPKGVELVAERKRGVRTPLDAFNSHDPIGYLVRANRGVGEAGEATFACWYDGKPVSRVERLRIVVCKAVKGVRPKRFMTGIHAGARIVDFPDDGPAEDFVDFMEDVGVSWSIINCSPSVRDVFHRHGVRVTPYDNDYFVNGFMVGHYRGKPESDRYVPLPLKLQPPDATTRWFLSKGSCPISIYTESDWFRTNTVPLLKSDCEGFDGFWANWEPYFYANRGCFCERCRKAFAEYAGIDTGELDRADWYELVRTEKGKYRIPWLEFRAREHGRVVRTIDKYVRKFTGPDSLGFVPGVCWIEMSSWYPPIQNAYASYAKQVRQVDFAGDIRWINPWGPYPNWSAKKPYVYKKACSMQSFFAAQDVREQVAKDYPEGRRPKLLAFPLGNLGMMIPQPEWIGMGIDSFFFHRWEAAVVYYLPRGGLDARSWQALANASTRAAKYEDIVLDGSPADDRVSVRMVAEYPAPCDNVTEYLPEKTMGQSLFQTCAYAKDGITIIAAFNFWERGEAFFDLSVRGLDGPCRLIDEYGVVYAKSRKCLTWTAEELASGVRLEVGAARTRVFEVRPAEGLPVRAMALRTLSESESRLNDRREALSAAAALEDMECGGVKADSSIALPH